LGVWAVCEKRLGVVVVQREGQRTAAIRKSQSFGRTGIGASVAKSGHSKNTVGLYIVRNTSAAGPRLFDYHGLKVSKWL